MKPEYELEVMFRVDDKLHSDRYPFECGYRWDHNGVHITERNVAGDMRQNPIASYVKDVVICVRRPEKAKPAAAPVEMAIDRSSMAGQHWPDPGDVSTDSQNKEVVP